MAKVVSRKTRKRKETKKIVKRVGPWVCTMKRKTPKSKKPVKSRRVRKGRKMRNLNRVLGGAALGGGLGFLTGGGKGAATGALLGGGIGALTS